MQLTTFYDEQTGAAIGSFRDARDLPDAFTVPSYLRQRIERDARHPLHREYARNPGAIPATLRDLDQAEDRLDPDDIARACNRLEYAAEWNRAADAGTTDRAIRGRIRQARELAHSLADRAADVPY